MSPEYPAKIKARSAKVNLTKKERKVLTKVYRNDLVKRSKLLRIAAAWVITVPMTGLMAAMTYLHDTRRGAALENGRGERIRTSDHRNPIAVRYQAALHPELDLPLAVLLSVTGHSSARDADSNSRCR